MITEITYGAEARAKIKAGIDKAAEAEINVGHDEIWIGEYNPDAMTEEERVWMSENGWREDEGAWVHFV